MFSVKIPYDAVATTNVTITTTPTLGAGIILCDNENITLKCYTDQSGANFTWQWSNRSVQADTITVLAKLTNTLYTCVVSDSSGQDIGKASITILANGEFLLACAYSYLIRLPYRICTTCCK